MQSSIVQHNCIKHICLHMWRLSYLVILISGFTKQYLQLNALLHEFSNTPFAILGFPCNQFGLQEPAKDKYELLNGLKYCRPGHGYVPIFKLSRKIEVNGPGELPLYTFLKVSLYL